MACRAAASLRPAALRPPPARGGEGGGGGAEGDHIRGSPVSAGTP
eukprot:SAG22_NODE_1334_length_4700_cov_27.727885_1_plen_44_part_10